LAKIGFAALAFWAVASLSGSAGEPISVDQLSGCWEKVYKVEACGKKKTDFEDKISICFENSGKGSAVVVTCDGGFPEGFGNDIDYTLNEGRLEIVGNGGNPGDGWIASLAKFACRVTASDPRVLMFADCNALPEVNGRWRKVDTR
jgi:hypothetical protein